MNLAFLDYYRCLDSHANFKLADAELGDSTAGYFAFGSGVVCYGRCAGEVSEKPSEALPDALLRARIEDSACLLPFNPTEIVNNLRLERYVPKEKESDKASPIREIYYFLRPALPVSVRRHLQRAWLKGWEKRPFPRWPVDKSVDRMFERLMRLALKASAQERIPFIWFWPDGKSSCAVMTHDVETEAGLQFAADLMDINDSFEIKSSFQLIPDARYVVGKDTLSAIKRRGFEVNVHDLKHDGRLYDDRERFRVAASRIDEFAVRFGSKGFRSGALYRNQDWYDEFHFSYDMSVPNVAHLDPQPGGCCTVMPYFVGSILEIPVTTTQDYSLFHILGDYSQDLWREQIGQIMRHHGLISFIVHPDYLDTAKARNTYTTLLGYLSRLRAEARLWVALPGEVDVWWRQRSGMRLVPYGNEWRIEGPGAQRARLAYAMLKDNEVTYVFP